MQSLSQGPGAGGEGDPREWTCRNKNNETSEEERPLWRVTRLVTVLDN